MQDFERLPLGIALLDRAGNVVNANRRIREWFRLLPCDPAGQKNTKPCPACGDQCCCLCRELRGCITGGDGSRIGKRLLVEGDVVLEARCERISDDDGFVLIVEDASSRFPDDLMGTVRYPRATGVPGAPGFRAGQHVRHDPDHEIATLLEERSRELTYNREFLRSLIETNRDLILSAGVDGEVTFTNSGFVGAPAGVLIGRPLDSLVETAFRADFHDKYNEVLGGLSSHVLCEAQGAGPLQNHWCLFSVGPVRSGGRISGLTVIVSDLTSLKEAWEKVRGGEKLVATGRMAARIAHEINNPLTGISGAIQLIKADLSPGAPAFRYAEMVEREIARVSNVVRQMYGLYRPEQEPSRVIDLRPVLEDVVTLMRPDADRKRVRLELHLVAREPALAQEQNLRQILMNIVRNAIEVTATGGLVDVAVERQGRCVDIVVSDQGPGITEELRQQMFEPFYTTKSTSGGRGLGLGLSVSDTLVKAMGGSIVFENRADGGARCRVCLPEGGVEPAGN